MSEPKIKITIEVPAYSQSPGKEINRDEIRQTELLDMVEINKERKGYFERLISQDSPDDALLLANSEAIMEAIQAYIDLRESLPEGFTWRDITQQLRGIYDDFPHKLPLQHRRLHNLFIRYTREGYEALIQ